MPDSPKNLLMPIPVAVYVDQVAVDVDSTNDFDSARMMANSSAKFRDSRGIQLDIRFGSGTKQSDAWPGRDLYAINSPIAVVL
jgi:hypothetical protein